MAFMMPVVKNDYNLYGSSCPSSRSGGTSKSSSLSSSPRGFSLSSSPSAASSFVGSPRNSHTPAFTHNLGKSESSNSLHKFHNRLLDKLKNTFRGNESSGSSMHGR